MFGYGWNNTRWSLVSPGSSLLRWRYFKEARLTLDFRRAVGNRASCWAVGSVGRTVEGGSGWKTRSTVLILLMMNERRLDDSLASLCWSRSSGLCAGWVLIREKFLRKDRLFKSILMILSGSCESELCWSFGS